jgi:hypothetical protein
MEGSFQVPEQYPLGFVNWSLRGQQWFPQSNVRPVMCQYSLCSIWQNTVPVP